MLELKLKRRYFCR